MLSILIASVAMAQPATDAEIRSALSTAAKRTVPKDSLCIARPEVPEVFGKGVAAVGLREDGQGCVLKGVMVRGKLRKSDPSAGIAKVQAAWNTMSAAQKGDALAAWTQGVFTAFGQPQGDPSVRVSKGKATVSQKWMHRASGGGISAMSTDTFTFDLESGDLVDRTTNAEQYWKTGFSTRPSKLTGSLTADNVAKALSTQGRPIKRCFRDHWEADLTHEGRLEVEWTVKDGKAGDYGVLSGDPPMDLLKCYVNKGIAQIEWPKELEGTARWVFWAQRAATSAPK